MTDLDAMADSYYNRLAAHYHGEHKPEMSTYERAAEIMRDMKDPITRDDHIDALVDAEVDDSWALRDFVQEVLAGKITEAGEVYAAHILAAATRRAFKLAGEE